MPNPVTQKRVQEPAGSKKPNRVDTSHLLDAASVAEYIGDFSTQFAELAERVNLPLLAYLLDMVRLEAHLVRTREAAARGAPEAPAGKRQRVGRQVPPR